MDFSNVFARMSGWQALEIKGPDARDFLHRLTSVNFKALQPGKLTPGTLLAPTGKILVYFKALHLEQDRYLFLVPPISAETQAAQYAQEAFEKLHFRENLRISSAADQWAYVRLLASDQKRIDSLKPLLPANGELKALQDGRIVFNEHRWNVEPYQIDLGILVPAQKLEGVVAALRLAGYSELSSLEAMRLRAADPGAPAELNTSTIPLEAKLDDAVHENKGCYPGQEVIERIRSMGQVPRALVLLSGTGEPPAAPTDILAEGATAGTLTSAAQDPFTKRWVGLGYIRRAQLKDGAVFKVGTQNVDVQIK